MTEIFSGWNGLLFFWGIFYTRKSSSLPELPVSRTNTCPQETVSEPVVQRDVFPKMPQPLVIDLNECPDDDLSDPAVPLGSEMEKTGTSIDQNIWFESRHEDRKLNACQIHQEKLQAPDKLFLVILLQLPIQPIFPNSQQKVATWRRIIQALQKVVTSCHLMELLIDVASYLCLLSYFLFIHFRQHRNSSK